MAGCDSSETKFPMTPYGRGQDLSGYPNDVFGCPNGLSGCPNDVFGCPNDLSGCPNDLFPAGADVNKESQNQKMTMPDEYTDDIPLGAIISEIFVEKVDIK
jgi:hypothetical protein